MALTLPILAKIGLISVAVKYAVDKYTDDSVFKAEDEVTKETINIQEPQTPDEGQSLLGKTCIENRRRILSLMEEQKKLVPGDAHKLLKEECAANKDSISSLTADLTNNNNAVVDSIAAVDRKTDRIYSTNYRYIKGVEDRLNTQQTAQGKHIKNTLDRTEFTYGDDALFTKDIKKELTIMEEALQTTEGRNAS